ncbi:MAG: histidinol-phosphate transaminase [Dehalococcoidia bacterium]|jgi:histidinol-phosphate aminotransferase
MSNQNVSIKRPVHGSITPAELRKLGLNIDDVIDFSSNINPLGMSDYLKDSMSNIDISRYPDPDCLELREALAEDTGLDISSIIVGNGSTELIHLIARAFLGGNSVAVILSPTYGEYETACRLAGTELTFIKAEEKLDFHWSIPIVCKQIKTIAPRIVFLCNPNNPTGVLLKSSDVKKIAASAAPGLLIIDEAYMPFADDPWDATTLLDIGNIIVMRSMTKDYALAGIRLGYIVAAPGIIERLKCYQPFWSVNAIAQAVGIAAINDNKHITMARKIVAEAKTYLLKSIEEIGLYVVPTSTNFLLIKVDNAKSMRQALLRQGICVRDCTSFGLPQYIRIAMQPLPECRRFVDGLRTAVTAMHKPKSKIDRSRKR